MLYVREIYNHLVSNSAVMLHDRHSSGLYWRDKHASLARLGQPFLVALSTFGAVLGYALAQPWAGANA